MLALPSTHELQSKQGRIYVENEYPTFLIAMSILSQKLNLGQIILNNEVILGYNIQILQLFSTLLVGCQRINTLQVEW
mgnify:CR=1 FL=1